MLTALKTPFTAGLLTTSLVAVCLSATPEGRRCTPLGWIDPEIDGIASPVALTTDVIDWVVFITHSCDIYRQRRELGRLSEPGRSWLG